MTDDPRAILKAVGVECAEVDDYRSHPLWVRTPHGELTIDRIQADAAILALARLVAKYKWQRGKLTERLLTERIASFTRGLSDDDEQQAIADAYRWKDRICTALDEEWAEHDA